MKSICGIDCTKCGLSGACNGCAATDGQPFGAECLVAQCCKKGETVLNELKEKLPNGQIVKFWDDNRIYLGNQLHKEGSHRCYGILADENHLMVSEYSGYGTDAEIIVFKRWN